MIFHTGGTVPEISMLALEATVSFFGTFELFEQSSKEMNINLMPDTYDHLGLLLAGLASAC